jgi:hypothetical protein
VTRKASSPFLVAAIALVVFRCTDSAVSGPATTTINPAARQGLVVSNSHTTPPGAAATGRASTSVSDEPGIVYVSLAPGTFPDAVEVGIENRTHIQPTLLVPVVDGGFDPVSVQANEGDTLAITPRTPSGSKDPILVKVPAKRPPSVVRTNPSKGRTDVALNVIVAVVFTEPVDRATVNPSSIQLLRDGRPVSGQTVLNSDSWTAEFVPDAALDPASTYEVVVTKQIRDIDGDVLDAPYSSTFVTGTTRCAEALGRRGCLPGIEPNRTITGAVTERAPDGVRLVPNATISAWIWLSDSTGYRLSDFQSDSQGRYTVTTLPPGKLQLHAEVAGLDQRCAVITKLLEPSATANIELVASGSQATERSSLANGIWGFVWEETLGTKVNLSGARVAFESPENVVVANATTDAWGNFTLCNLPSFGRTTLLRTYISIGKPGFETDRWEEWSPPVGRLEMFIPLRRSTPSP